MCAVRAPQYRTLVNYRSPEFLGPRIGDKVIFSLLVRLGRKVTCGLQRQGCVCQASSPNDRADWQDCQHTLRGEVCHAVSTGGRPPLTCRSAVAT